MNKLGKTLFIAIGIVLFFGGILHAQTTVTGVRDLPTTVSGGNSVTYTIHVNVDEANSPDGVLISETLPPGWVYNSSSLPDNKVDSAGVISWLFLEVPDGIVLEPGHPISKEKVEDTTITLTVDWVDPLCGEAAFSGQVRYLDAGSNQQETNVTGDIVGRIPLGDVNDDGRITIGDAMFIGQDSVGLTITGTYISAEADVNCDGRITIGDAMFTGQNAVGLDVPAWCTNICP